MTDLLLLFVVRTWMKFDKKIRFWYILTGKFKSKFARWHVNKRRAARAGAIWLKLSDNRLRSHHSIRWRQLLSNDNYDIRPIMSILEKFLSSIIMIGRVHKLGENDDRLNPSYLYARMSCMLLTVIFKKDPKPATSEHKHVYKKWSKLFHNLAYFTHEGYTDIRLHILQISTFLFMLNRYQ